MTSVRSRGRTRVRKRLRPPLRSEPRTKLDEGLIRDFLDLVEQKGLPLDGCCDFLGVPQTSFWDWIHRGQKYAENPRRNRRLRIYGAFLRELRAATAAYRCWLLDNLHDAGRYWTKWMTELERRDRANFSKFEQQGGDAEEQNPDDRFL